jgi:GNAT superfamily N-acetyltransferase
VPDPDDVLDGGLDPGLALSPYDAARDRALVLAWANAPDTAMWLTGRDGPVLDDELNAWHATHGATGWLLTRERQPVGYGEIHTVDGGYTQVMRLVVDPARRRGGLGRALLRTLIAQARVLHPGQPIYARVAPGNHAALLMYPDAGLVPLDPLPPGLDPNAIWLTALDADPPVLGGRVDDE